MPAWRISLVLVCLVLSACARHTPAPPPPITIALGQPASSGDNTAYPVSVTNNGTAASARLRLGCRFFDSDGVLVFTGGLDVDRLAPGETRSAPILIPHDTAATIARLDCSVEGS